MSDTTIRELGQAQARLLDEDAPGALDHLLRAWHDCPTPAIAGPLDRLSRAIDACLPPLAPYRRGDVDAWLDLADLERASDIPRLLAALGVAPPRVVARRLQSLTRRPRDPRIAAALVGLVGTRQWTSKSSRPAWTLVFALIEQMADPAGRPALQAELRHFQSQRPVRTFEPYMARRLQTCLDRLPARAPRVDPRLPAALRPLSRAIAHWAVAPPRDEASLFAQCARVTDDDPRAVEQDLLAAVYDRPLDDGPRLVLADWYLERGDLRGELITLQIDGRAGSASRAKRLLREHATAWLGELAPVVEVNGRRFCRGFLDAALARFTTPAQRRLIDHPAWRTVSQLDSDDPALLLREDLPALQILGLGACETPRTKADGPRETPRTKADGPRETPRTKADGPREIRFTETTPGISPPRLAQVQGRANLPRRIVGLCLALDEDASLPELARSWPQVRQLHLRRPRGDWSPQRNRAWDQRLIAWLRAQGSALELLSVATGGLFSSWRPDLSAWLAMLSAAAPHLRQLTLRLEAPWTVHLLRDPTQVASAWTMHLVCRTPTIWRDKPSTSQAAETQRVRSLAHGARRQVGRVVVSASRGRLESAELQMVADSLARHFDAVTLPAPKQKR